MSPISVTPAAFKPRLDTDDWHLIDTGLKNRAALTVQTFYANVAFPNGVTVSKVTLYGHRDDAASAMSIILKRIDRVENDATMATCTSDWTDGTGSIYDDSIANAVIDNSSYSYILQLSLNPNDTINDVRFTGAMIDFTG